MKRPHEQALLFLRKAESDLTLLEEVWASTRVADEVIGFHGQQAAEKLLKALLSHLDVSFPRTHNLRVLMDLLADAGGVLPSHLRELDALTPFGTVFRYEDIPTTTNLDRKTAAEMIRGLHAYVRQQLQPSSG